MIVNGATLLAKAPIKYMETIKLSDHGVSFGLGEAGYDIRIKQEIHFVRNAFNRNQVIHLVHDIVEEGYTERQILRSGDGRFTIASTIEEFEMPNNLVGIVHDKSTWARRGLSVFNTVIEPGWRGFLTLELVYHGNDELIIPAGAGIAQVVFHLTTDMAAYEGKYQDQGNQPVDAKESY